MGICKYCKDEFENKFMGGHVKWCLLNPKRTKYLDDLEKLHANFSISDTNRLERNRKIKKLHEDGAYSHLKEIKSFKGKHHSEESKKQISLSRKKWISENKEKFNWNINKNKSIPCELFKEKLKEMNVKFIEEYSPFTEHFYSIDIALPDKMIAIEINGNQHYNLNGTLQEYYQHRHNFIISKGWNVYEIHFSKVYSDDIDELINNILEKNRIILEFDYEFWMNSHYNRKNSELHKKEKLKIENINILKKKLLDSDIDFSKFGWVNKASTLINKQSTKINGWMKKNMLEFYNEKCFKRNKHDTI
jgi:very-short-patch-repair endonuclease